MTITGISVARGPDMSPIVVRHNQASPRPHIPEDPRKPTYQRLRAVHEGTPAMEVRKRAASLDESCQLMETNHPAPPELISRTFRTGQVTTTQAQELREYIHSLPQGQEYLRDEALLLLEAGGHTLHQNDGTDPQY